MEINPTDDRRTNLYNLRKTDAVLGKYLKGATNKIQWEDLKYIAGKIMYGGHIAYEMEKVLYNDYLYF